MRVGDVMRAVPVTIRATATMKEALQIMVTHKINGLIVTDEVGKVEGILSSWDIIQLIVPDYLEDDKHLAAFEAESTFDNRIVQTAETAVAEFMTKDVHSIMADDSLMNAATVLSEFHIRQLPVVNEEGILVGYLNRTDMKIAIAGVLGIK